VARRPAVLLPNGMTVTADNSTLIVADSYRHQLVGFDIGADGGLSGRRVWADLGDGVPDGICTDAQGAVWYADVPNQRWFRLRPRRPRAEHAVHRGRRMAGQTDSEMVPAGSGQVLAVDVEVPGAGWP
jgi:sugar lactone lactonase YvrE